LLSYAKQALRSQGELQAIPCRMHPAEAKLPTCPGLFYGSSARDGILTRIRIVGGILNTLQCQTIADFCDRYGDGYVQVTNRANLQIRGIQTAIAPEILKNFQNLGLAAAAIELDPIRNIMASPTAGIDAISLLDTSPLVKAWDRYLQTHLELADLSPKFSVCLDGGESVSVRALRNDITLIAERNLQDSSKRYLRLCLNVGSDSFQDVSYNTGMTNITIPANPVERVVELLASLAQVYVEYIRLNGANSASDRKPRLRHLLSDWGVETYLERVQKLLSFPLTLSADSQATPHRESYPHLGIHAQSQPNRSYVGLVLPLGRIQSVQLRSLANLAQIYGSGELRLTPWQNLLLPNIPNDKLDALQAEIAELGLHWSQHRIDSAIAACAGLSGCASSATHTQTHAMELIGTLAQKIHLDRPVNIHFSGCPKSCAQHSPSDIALVGTQISKGDRRIEAYDIYVGTPDRSNDLLMNSSFGRLLWQSVGIAEIPTIVERMLRAYQQRASLRSQSFKEFVAGYSIPELQQFLTLEARQ
jgi:ferredoxin-nitrite reductase